MPRKRKNAVDAGVPTESVAVTRARSGPGRPSSYTRELAAAVLSGLCEGRSLRSVCEDPGMPSRESVRRWVHADIDGFAAAYEAAKRERAEHWADEIVDVADNPALLPEHKRIMVDTRKWLLARLLPREYGDRQAVEHSGEVRHGVIVLPAIEGE